MLWRQLECAPNFIFAIRWKIACNCALQKCVEHARVSAVCDWLYAIVEWHTTTCRTIYISRKPRPKIPAKNLTMEKKEKKEKCSAQTSSETSRRVSVKMNNQMKFMWIVEEKKNGQTAFFGPAQTHAHTLVVTCTMYTKHNAYERRHENKQNFRLQLNPDLTFKNIINLFESLSILYSIRTRQRDWLLVRCRCRRGRRVCVWIMRAGLLIWCRLNNVHWQSDIF